MFVEKVLLLENVLRKIKMPTVSLNCSEILTVSTLKINFIGKIK